MTTEEVAGVALLVLWAMLMWAIVAMLFGTAGSSGPDDIVPHRHPRSRDIDGLS